MPFEYELSVALAAVRSAAQICQTVQASITPEVLGKMDQSPVTMADFASQAVVCQAIGQSFPHDPIIAEEDSFALRQPENQRFLSDICTLINGHQIPALADEICCWIDRGCAKEFSSRFWTLDPIDGTKGFLRRDQYAVSLALIVDGQIQLGVLGCPNLSLSRQPGRSLFYAIRQQGSFATSLEPGGIVERMHVTSTTDPMLARFCESLESGHSSHNESALIAKRLSIQKVPMRMDSQAKYATVAMGEADVYLRLPTRVGYHEKIWDHAGGVIVVEEAGGRVTDLDGLPLDFSHGRELTRNRGVIVTNGPLHEAVLAAAQATINTSSTSGTVG